MVGSAPSAFETPCLGLNVAVGAKDAQIAYLIVQPVTVNVINLEGRGPATPLRDTAFLALRGLNARCEQAIAQAVASYALPQLGDQCRRDFIRALALTKAPPLALEVRGVQAQAGGMPEETALRAAGDLEP